MFHDFLRPDSLIFMRRCNAIGAHEFKAPSLAEGAPTRKALVDELERDFDRAGASAQTAEQLA